tara:strand:- start:1802 stop:2131 length:330 start_codon:yes stop_codon:yes gene_type:complete
MSKDDPVVKPLKSPESVINDGKFNLKNVLEMTINFMEIAENMQEVEGSQRKEYVLYKMKTHLGMLYDSYKHEINTIIESVIFMTKLGRIIMINDQNIKKSCIGSSCFKF